MPPKDVGAPEDAGVEPVLPASALDLEGLRVFLAIVERGGVTSAAERVARTPAAVSMQLKKLEDILGRKLFERGPRGMSLTADGERLLGPARRMAALQAETLAAFRGPALSGAVRVGLIDDFGGARLTEALAAFSRTHPEVEVAVTLGPTETLYKKLEDGRLDFSLLTPGGVTPWRPTDLPVHEEALVWVGAAGGAAHRRAVLPIAVADSGCAWRRMAIDALDRAGRPYRIAYTSDFYIGQKAAVSADLAVAPLPRSVVEPSFEVLSGAHGFPEAGRCRIGLRWAGDEEGRGRSEAARALASALAGVFGGARGRP